MLAKIQKMASFGLFIIAFVATNASQKNLSANTETSLNNAILINPYLEANLNVPKENHALFTMRGDTLISLKQIGNLEEQKNVTTRKVYVTAYSSTSQETDDTPFITAKGTMVRDGIIATNFLPFGTKVTLPAIFGNKEFIVEDRMNKRYWDRVDIWMPSRGEALNFGVKLTDIVIEI